MFHGVPCVVNTQVEKEKKNNSSEDFGPIEVKLAECCYIFTSNDFCLRFVSFWADLRFGGR